MKEKRKKIIEYILIIIVAIIIIFSIVRLLGGYIKDNTTKRSCNLVDKVYVEGDKPGDAMCIPK